MRRASFALATLALILFSPSSQAQLNDENQKFLDELTALPSQITASNAKDIAQKCAASGAQVDGLQGLNDAQRLGFKAEAEHFISMAMRVGGYSDETGDRCSHHYAYTEGFAAATEGWLKAPQSTPEYMQALAALLKTALNDAKQMGCSDDYEKFAPTIAAAEAAGNLQPKGPDMDFYGEILTVTQGISKDNAKAEIEKCQALKPKFMAKKDLFEIETLYFPALIEQCLSIAMENGAAPDEDGDACKHLYNFADGAARALAVTKRDPAQGDLYGDLFTGDLVVATGHAKELGCTQDFAALKQQ